MELTLALIALAVVLLFAMVRPHGWPEVVVALPAAGVLIASGSISLRDAGTEIGQLLPVVGFLAAVLVLARLCDDEGLFHAAGGMMARFSAGNPRRLLAIVFVIASATTAILSLDATVVLLTATFDTKFPDATSRIIQGILTGIGFLGAGVIIHRENRSRVQGLTSAACTWLTACVGIVCGAGQWRIVAVVLGITFLVLIVGGRTERWLHRALGGNIQIIGSPETVVDKLVGLKRAGCDGIQVAFDFAPDLEFFGEAVLPLMYEAGLRI